jgi:hypothetical protein
METEDESNDLGTLVSEKVTAIGFGFAMLDIAVMAIDMVAMLYTIRLFASYEVITLESVTILAISLFFLERWIRDWLRVTCPNGHYEYVRKFVKEGKTTTITSIHLVGDN